MSAFSAKVVDIHRPEVLVLETTGGERVTVTVIGMESPGRRHPSMPKGVYFAESLARAEELLSGVEVTVEPDLASPETEKAASGQSLRRHIRLHDQRSYAEEMIREGFARYYAEFAFETGRMDRYETAQTQARMLKRGLWGREAVPPGEYQSYGYTWDDFGGDLLVVLYAAGVITLCAMTGGAVCIFP